MALYLRPFNADTDLPRLAELLAQANNCVLTAERLVDWSRCAPLGRICLRVVAIQSGGSMVGYGEVGRDPWLPSGTYWLDLVVDATLRRQGIGSILYDDLLQFAWEQGATRLETQPRRRTHASERFLEQRGFTLSRRGAARELTGFGTAAAPGSRSSASDSVVIAELSQDAAATVPESLYQLSVLPDEEPAVGDTGRLFAELQALLSGCAASSSHVVS